MIVREFASQGWEGYYIREAKWHYTLSLLPRRCWISRRWLWGRHFKLTRTFAGVGGVFEEVRWLHRDVGMEIKLMLL